MSTLESFCVIFQIPGIFTIMVKWCLSLELTFKKMPVIRKSCIHDFWHCCKVFQNINLFNTLNSIAEIPLVTLALQTEKTKSSSKSLPWEVYAGSSWGLNSNTSLWSSIPHDFMNQSSSNWERIKYNREKYPRKYCHTDNCFVFGGLKVNT